jgi:hypothetical protein
MIGGFSMYRRSVLLYACLTVLFVGVAGPPVFAIKPNTFEPVAVVELFTSEGCSSCPPADRLLGEIEADARASQRRIFPLAFHVDYWNSLGWNDPFSSSESSERQRAYGRTMGLESIYTPQMIVNGTDQFVGHRAVEAEASITRALSQRVPVKISLEVQRRSESEWDVVYETMNASEDLVLNVALVQRETHQDVAAGENMGRRLPHFNVVRFFKTVPIGSGSLTLVVPRDVVSENLTVIGYVQNQVSMRIEGAIEGKVNP